MLRFVGKIAVAILFALLLAGCAGKEKATITKLPVTLRLSEVHAKGYPTAMADEERVSDADMEIIKQAAKQTQEFEIEKWKEKEQSAEQIVKANGNTVIELSSSAFAEFQSAMQPLYDTYGKGYESLINEIRTTN